MSDYRIEVPRRLEAIRRRIAEAALRAGRDSRSVELLAVSKQHPIEAVIAAYDAGLRRFGENRVQEAVAKYASFALAHSDARLDMLGHLQGNKVGKALPIFSCIQSVDSLALLESLISRCGRPGNPGSRGLEILFEYRTGEETKSGFEDSKALFAACERLASAIANDSTAVVPRGLMTIAPLADDEALLREAFRRLARLAESIRQRFGFKGFDTLSMGMSHDFEIAIEEGSTLVRIGTALFGERAL